MKLSIPESILSHRRLPAALIVVSVVLSGISIVGLVFTRVIFDGVLTLIFAFGAWSGFSLFALAICLLFHRRMQRYLNAVISRESMLVREEVAGALTQLKAEVNDGLVDGLKGVRNESRRLVASSEQRVSADLVEMIEERESTLLARIADDQAASEKRVRNESRRLVASSEQRVSAGLAEVIDGRAREVAVKFENDLSFAIDRKSVV